MKQPYERLLGHLRDNPVINNFLLNDVPDFGRIWTEAMPSLSSGERILVEVALALWNGNGTARISDIFMLDEENQTRVVDALVLKLEKWEDE